MELKIRKELQEMVRKIIRYIGDDPNRNGLIDTPARVVKMWETVFSGYNIDPKIHIKTFDKGQYDEMILVKNVEIYSMCEHHILPFYGTAHIAYIPTKDDGKIIGVSKIARIVDVFSRRLQIQERLTNQITDFLMKELRPLGVGCIIKAKHLCMMMRGVQKQNSEMITSSMMGVFRDDNKAREEFINLCK